MTKELEARVVEYAERIYKGNVHRQVFLAGFRFGYRKAVEIQGAEKTRVSTKVDTRHERNVPAALPRRLS